MQPNTPPPIPTPPVNNTAATQRTNKLKTTWGIICLVAPTALVVVSIIAYAILNFIAGSQEAARVASDSLLTDATPSPLHTIGNVLLFLVGAIAVMTWLPGIIIGIILLATRKRV